jgi:hypothetical protein
MANEARFPVAVSGVLFPCIRDKIESLDLLFKLEAVAWKQVSSFC